MDACVGLSPHVLSQGLFIQVAVIAVSTQINLKKNPARRVTHLDHVSIHGNHQPLELVDLIFHEAYEQHSLHQTRLE